MPAVSAVVAERQVFRPHWIRVAAVVSSVVIVLLLAWAWTGMTGEVRATFDWLQQTMLVLIFGSGLLGLWSMFRTRVEVRSTGLVVVNGFRRHTFDWAEVLGVSMGRHRPWAQVSLTSGRSVALMAIQTADGERARRAARELARAVNERTV